MRCNRWIHGNGGLKSIKYRHWSMQAWAYDILHEKVESRNGRVQLGHVESHARRP